MLFSMGDKWLGRKQRHFHAHEIARFDELSGVPLASFRQRAWAMVIDLAIIEALKLIFGIHGHHKHDLLPGEHMTMAELLMEGVEWLKELVESVVYFGLLVKLMNGRTPGKYFMKARIVSLTQQRMGWWQSIERALGYGASLLEGGFGFVQFFMTRNQQCVHDRIAETIVIDERPGAKRLANEDTEKVDATYA